MTATEVRIALVLNGGVSLAVWMGGVVHEIDLLRRASTGRLPPEKGDPDRAVYDAWRAICEELGVTVRVDIIAGSSAGGLNGAFLATAIARGVALPALRDVWRDLADLDARHLLQPPPPSTQRRVERDPAPASVLSGDFFGKSVVGVLDDMRQNQGARAATGEPEREEVTLFLTSTATGPQPRRIHDSDGVPLVIQDHRRLYKFPHRRELEYTPPYTFTEKAPASGQPETPWCDDAQLLAHAARASSSFPVAFPSVPEFREDAQANAQQLKEFRVLGTDDAWLMDGGVLDNAPFGPVLDEIARTPVDNPRQRALVYLVPSVDESREVDEPPEGPGWQRVLSTALFLPREADLRDDVDAIERLVQEAQHWVNGPRRLFKDLRTGTPEFRASCRATAETLLPSYESARTTGGINDALSTWARGADARTSLGRTSPSGSVPATGWVPTSADDLRPTSVWRWGTAVADRVLRLLLRDLRDQPFSDTTSAGMRGVSEQLLKVAAVRDAVVGHLVQHKPKDPEPSADEALAHVNEAIRELKVAEALCAIVRDGAAAYLGQSTTDDAKTDAATADLIETALVVEVVTGSFTADRTFTRPVAFDFFRFGPDIATPRVVVHDPNNPNRVLPPGPWKLWGTRLGHFAAFGRSDWRDADWMWGRLDGMAHLVRLLARESDGHASRFVAQDRVAHLQGLLLGSQDRIRTTDELTEQARRLAALDNRDVLSLWSADSKGLDSLLDVIESALRTARSRTNGNNALVANLADLLTKVLARSMPPGVSGGPVRVLAKVLFVHRRLVKALRKPGRAGGGPTRED